MKFILSGGCGFIGSNLALSLLEEGHQVLNLDALTYAANTQGFEKYSANQYRLIKIDLGYLGNWSSGVLTEPEILKQIEKFQPDYLIHLAAESMVDKSLKINRVFFESNVIGTWAILELLRSIEVKKAIITSTDEVYGAIELANLKIDDFESGFNEDDRLNPRNPYAGSKAAADQIALSYRHSFNLPICIVRPTNNFGPRQNLEKFLPKTITNILKKEKVPVYGDPKLYYREWLYVEDTVRAFKLLLEEGIPGEIYNVGSGERHSNYEIVEMICQILKVNIDEVMQSVENRVGHDQAYSVNSSKIRKLGWAPEINLQAGLERTVEYYE